jgi:1-acyl-sn-glycerol-3-phosphate acyltransferase
MAYAIARLIVGVIFRVFWRPRVEGLENVPQQGAVIIASNHLSFIDSVVIPLAVPRRVRFLAKAEYFSGRGLRGRGMALFFHLIDAVPVERTGNRDSMRSLESALAVLREGTAFGIYPEGTRSRDGRLYRGRTGVGWLALTSGAPVVPVGLTGTDRVQPVGARGVRIAPVRVRFGPAVDPADYAGMPAGRARRALTDEVMERIAALSPQQRADTYNEPPAGGDEVDANTV